MTVGYGDQGGIAMSPATVLGRLEQLIDFGWRKILARPQRGICLPTKRIGLNLPVYVTWLDQVKARIH